MGVAVGVAVGMAVGTVEMFPTAAGDFCAPESSYRRFWNGKRSEIAISSSCCKESLIHQAVRPVLKTCSPLLKMDYIQLALTNWKVPVRLNFNSYPMIFFVVQDKVRTTRTGTGMWKPTSASQCFLPSHFFLSSSTPPLPPLPSASV